MKATPWIIPLSGLLTVGLLLSSGCSSVDIHSQVNPGYALNDYISYSWETQHTVKGDAASGFIPLHQTLVNAVNQQMTQRGYQLVETADADLRIHYSIDIRIEETSTPSSIVDSGNPGSSLLSIGGSGRVALEAQADVSDQQEIETASLVISINRIGVKDPLWVCSADGDLFDGLPMDARKTRVRNIVANMFSSLPTRR